MENQSLENQASPENDPGPLRIGRYEIKSLVGRGAFGRVLAAQDPVLNRRVAVKVITPDAPAEVRLELLERFRMEAQVLANLTHPNIVAVYDAGFDSNMPFLAMELCDGPNLETILEARKVLTPAQAVWITLQAAAGVDYIHHASIVHRDLKPSNILFHKGQFKITDFGLARSADMGRFTAAGQVMGTPHYMSPEQARGDHVDARSDLYALGAILFRMLAGRPPFLGDPVAVMTQLVSRPPPRLSLVAPRLPSQLDDVLAKALGRIPEDRYQSAAELCADLLQVIPRDQVLSQGDVSAWLRPGAAVPAGPLPEGTPTGGSSISLNPSNGVAAPKSTGVSAAVAASVHTGAAEVPAEEEEEELEDAPALQVGPGRLDRVLEAVFHVFQKPPSRRVAAGVLVSAAFLGGLGAGHGVSGLFVEAPGSSSDGPTLVAAAQPVKAGTTAAPGPGPAGQTASPAGTTAGSTASAAPVATSSAAPAAPVVAMNAAAPTAGGSPGPRGTAGAAPAAPLPAPSRASQEVPIKLDRIDDLFQDEPGWTPPPPRAGTAADSGAPADSAPSIGAGGSSQGTSARGSGSRSGSSGGSGYGGAWFPSTSSLGGPPVGNTGAAPQASNVPTRVRVAGGNGVMAGAAGTARGVKLAVQRADIENAPNMVTFSIQMTPYIRGTLVFARWRPPGGKWSSLAVLDLHEGNYAIHLVDIQGMVELEVGFVDSAGRHQPQYSRMVDATPGR